jgi:hypothetical protein
MRAFPALPQGRGKTSSYGVKFLRFSSLNLQKFALSECCFAHGCCRFFKLFGALDALLHAKSAVSIPVLPGLANILAAP